MIREEEKIDNYTSDCSEEIREQEIKNTSPNLQDDNIKDQTPNVKLVDNNNAINEEEKVLEEQLNNQAKTLSPSQIVLKRFFRSKLSILGLIMIAFLFLFSFVGPLFSPYGEIEPDDDGGEIQIIPTKIDFKINSKEVVNCSNLQNELVYKKLISSDGSLIKTYSTAFELTIVTNSASDFVIYLYGKRYDIYSGSTSCHLEKGENSIVIGLNNLTTREKISIEYLAVKPLSNDEFIIKQYGVSVDEISNNFTNLDYDSSFSQIGSDNEMWHATKEDQIKIVEGTNEEHFVYDVTFSPTIINSLSYPSKKHWLGTDKDGYDVLTRLMYGGRISLKIGFLVVFLQTFLGIIFGSLAGYFGKWVDMVIMRIVDIFYCVPTLPILLIASKVIEENNVNEHLRIYFLMGFLCLFGWAGVARLVRGQILALREQEYMTAAKALGLSVPRQIFKHLIPNVMPQLIVTMTLGLGGVILTESTLSFLGLGVPIPYAAWGSMISGLQTTEILSEHFHLWGPPGFCIVLAVLGFNFIGDGLRDAFDPKSKR